MDMQVDELLKRISVDPQVCHGKACIRGHRIPVSMILDMLTAGEDSAAILAAYPQLDDWDLRACLAYGAFLARGESRSVTLPSAS
jgi:uncharacterized protein (DUF433 family)